MVLLKDYWNITQTWPPGFCHESPCIPGKTNLTKFTIHTIHGLCHPPTPSQLVNCRNQTLPHLRFVFKFLNIK